MAAYPKNDPDPIDGSPLKTQETHSITTQSRPPIVNISIDGRITAAHEAARSSELPRRAAWRSGFFTHIDSFIT
jgi:hypothetical protein